MNLILEAEAPGESVERRAGAAPGTEGELARRHQPGFFQNFDAGQERLTEGVDQVTLQDGGELLFAVGFGGEARRPRRRGEEIAQAKAADQVRGLGVEELGDPPGRGERDRRSIRPSVPGPGRHPARERPAGERPARELPAGECPAGECPIPGREASGPR